jgi:branched-chain amino acid transport system substrate-binding protein
MIFDIDKEGLVVKMKRIYLFFLTICLSFSCCAKRDRNIIRVALVCPLTGDVAAMGQGMKRASQMAIDETNVSGRFPGITFELAAFDDRADPKEAVNAANRIITDPKIYGVIGHLNSGCSIPASRIYARRNLVMVSPASTNPKVTLQGLKNVFRVCTTDDVQGCFAADYVLDSLKYKTFAVIHDKTAYGLGIAESFRKRVEAKGGTVVSFDGIDLGDKDFKALLTAIKMKKPQLIYFGGMYTECGMITKQSKELGLDVPVFSDDGTSSPEYSKIGGKASEGDYITMIGVPPEKLSKSKLFMDNYRAKYPEQDMQPYDPYTYECAMIIVEAIQKTGRDRSKMADYLANVKYKGILGETSFDKNGDTLNNSVSIYRVQDGKFVCVD